MAKSLLFVRCQEIWSYTMKRFSEKAVGAAAFVTALCGSLIALPILFDTTPAFALDAPGAMPAPRPWEHRRLPGEMIEARLAYAKTALKITDAQSKQWNAVADVLRKQAKERDATITAMVQARDANKDAHHSIIDRLEMGQKMAAKRAAGLSELLAVAQPLYAVLSEEQKETADHLMPARFGGGWGGFRHGPDGHGGPGGPEGGPGGPPPR
jgi:hypothetical protein